VIAGRGAWAVSRLGFRGAAFRPGRSVLSAALVAAAAFIIVSVDAFRRGTPPSPAIRGRGPADSRSLPNRTCPSSTTRTSPAGREELLIRAPELADVRFTRFRLRPGEDASCLNLYRPTNPKIIAPEASFIEEAASRSPDRSPRPTRSAPTPGCSCIAGSRTVRCPVIADATSLQYVLHASLGDTMAIDVGAERPITLRFVAALRDSVLQGEIVMGEAHFVRLFPGQDGFRYFLIDAPEVTTRARRRRWREIVERELQPFGVDAVSTADRLDAFHRVENTYLSTFQALGGLGLLLGTVGLATVMFRNVLERRRELALLRAVGYDGRHVTVMILAETIFILCAGLLAGAGCALIAIAPALADRGGSLPGAGLALLLGGVLAAGVLSAMVATRAAVSGHVLQALRAE
jgi:putative ABC transport system permease protein